MEPTPKQILDLKVLHGAGGARTVREYLINLLTALWADRDKFSGKRPFGDSGWEYDLYIPLIRAGYVHGEFVSGFVVEVDSSRANSLIHRAIKELGK